MREPLLDLANQQEAFAGYYCANGDLIVGIAGTNDEDTRQSIVALVEATGVSTSCYNRDVPFHHPKVLVENKKYNFLSLRTWRDTIAHDFFESGKPQAIAIDYEKNQVLMWVEPYARSASIAVAQSFQLPSDAYEVIEEPRSSRVWIPS